MRPAGRRRPAGVGGCWQMGRSREARVAQSFRMCPSCSLLGSARVGGGGLDPAHLAEGPSDLDTCTPPILSVGSAGSAAPCTCWALTWSLAHAGLSLPHAQAPGAGPQSSCSRGAPVSTQAKAWPCELGGSCSSLRDPGFQPSEHLGTEPEPYWLVLLLVQTSGTLGLGVRLLVWPLLGLSAGADLICHLRCGQGPEWDFFKAQPSGCHPGTLCLIAGSECECALAGVLLHLGCLAQTTAIRQASGL